ncbi:MULTISPECIES: N-acetyltransferase [unclassified Ensifer]|uniref:GNAT family N-acetyltransferase n=1 Tax=unclassified Ensifer TaxID=2633371 RepID=UPI000813257E|nr:MULTISPECIES: N-acetyltransferase [unclassified Ensifer]OCO99101.1 GCN5 family acetyltransferase [Ensifer sp. LC11]OCO99302.1 GCN5 family acetyltransferase [Ensifer sp. LC13]OCP12947.1 GCN5 family acetyltransferase [Ensifer sp. LC14]OCP29659.1 GCN5 family acetyltransferase [Ensifer sp. LC499]
MQDLKDETLIRPATAEDASSLAAISLEVWLNTYIRDGVNAFFADYALEQFTTARFKDILSQENENIWVSQNTGGIDGFLRMSSNSPPPIDIVSDLELTTLYVQPRHHGRGIGKRLLETGLQFCANTGSTSTWLAVNAENEKATAFYIASGFEKIGETHFRIGDQAYPNHVLQLRLDRSDIDLVR